jgi:hypothetical protein
MLRQITFYAVKWSFVYQELFFHSLWSEYVLFSSIFGGCLINYKILYVHFATSFKNCGNETKSVWWVKICLLPKLLTNNFAKIRTLLFTLITTPIQFYTHIRSPQISQWIRIEEINLQSLNRKTILGLIDHLSVLSAYSSKFYERT